MSGGLARHGGRLVALGVALASLALSALGGASARAAEIGGQGTLRPGGGLPWRRSRPPFQTALPCCP